MGVGQLGRGRKLETPFRRWPEHQLAHPQFASRSIDNRPECGDEGFGVETSRFVKPVGKPCLGRPASVPKTIESARAGSHRCGGLVMVYSSASGDGTDVESAKGGEVFDQVPVFIAGDRSRPWTRRSRIRPGSDEP